jgi:hypothetical protein
MNNIAPLINAGFDNSQGHHPALNPLINAVTGKPTTFIDQDGSITVGPGSLNVQGKNYGVNLTNVPFSEISPVGIGGSYKTDDGRTSVSVTVNPYEKGNFGGHIGFKHGGVDHTPVPTEFYIDGLDNPVSQIESPQQTAAQELLRNRLDQIHEERVKANPKWYEKGNY